MALRMAKNLNGFHLCFGLLKILHCSLCFFFLDDKGVSEVTIIGSCRVLRIVQSSL